MERLYFLLLLVSMFFYGCLSPSVDDINLDSVNLDAFRSSEVNFSFKMFNSYPSNDENVIISPWSIYSAMAMLYEGANGSTYDIMKNNLYLINRTVLRDSYYVLNGNFSGSVMKNANSLWIDNNFKLNKSYANLVGLYYDSEVYTKGLSDDHVLSEINGWIDSKTNGRIKKLFSSIDPNVRLILLNAVYFDSSWKYKFDRRNTHKDIFYNLDNSTSVIQMMSLSKHKLEYYNSTYYSAVRLPYSQDGLYMYVILPYNGSSIVNFSYDDYLSLKSNLMYRDVLLYLPKLKLSYSDGLIDNFRSFNLGILFDKDCDLSLISDNLYVNDILHKSSIIIDEDGTEAAAATGVTIGLTSMPKEPPVIFRVDHPFIFIIEQERIGILFIGIINKI